MVSQGFFSVGGIASGLDTETMIEQLLALERQPVRRLERQQADLGAVKDAWAKVTTKLSSLRTAVDDIARADRFDGFMSVTSSNEDAVTVSATGTADTGSLSFTVEQLATRQQQSYTDVFTGTDDLLAGRELQITVDGTTHDLTAGLGPDPTLGDLVDAVNAADLGVKATALQVDAGEFRLVLDATATGEDGTFDVTGTGWGVSEVQAAKDAQLQVGGITVTRSSNTIDDLVEGATIELRATTTDPVTIRSDRDIDGAVKAVKGFVDGINGVLTTLKDLTAYDPESREAGPLQGEALARRLADSLRDAVSHRIPGLEGSDALASSLGISLTREGTLAFDEATVRQAFTDDFEGTAARLGRAGSTTDEAALFLNATSAATPGTYQVQVTQEAKVASATGDPYVDEAPAAGEERILRFETRDGSFTDIKLTEDHATVADAVAHIRDRLEADGVTAFDVTDEGGALKVATVAYGSAARFQVTEVDVDGNDTGGNAFGLAQGEVFGVDVAGTIGDEAATGTGRTLQGIAGATEGISVRIDGKPADFKVTWSRGLVGEVSAALARAEGSGGLVAQARGSLDSQVEIYQDRIDSFERRLETREATIRRQFVAMETMLGQLNSQGNWLNQQLAGLSGLNQQA